MKYHKSEWCDKKVKDKRTGAIHILKHTYIEYNLKWEAGFTSETLDGKNTRRYMRLQKDVKFFYEV